jgi:diaminobutyrate-2-oxoglutarate transaminase
VSLSNYMVGGRPRDDDRSMDTFERLESEVRSYCRHFPGVFTRASGSRVWAENGRSYVDFLSGAGALNYGHNHPVLKLRLMEYLGSDAIVHGLDLSTAAKREFLETFDSVILRPRGLAYKAQFPGPGGTQAVEAALKLARKVTGRRRVIAFTGAFHGMTLGALAVNGQAARRAVARASTGDATILPFDGSLEELERQIELDPPAAFLVECVQGEGGVNVARRRWLAGLERIARAHSILLIVDDIQAGCGRCGSFFSFERAGLTPDIVCLSKSLSGYGLPLAMTLIRPELDVWTPGEHNGTFRGFNPAYVTATAALDEYWRDPDLMQQVRIKGEFVSDRLQEIALLRPALGASVRGCGLMHGLELGPLAADVSRRAFEMGLIVETAGPSDHVLKLLPPLTISLAELAFGLDVIEAAVDAAVPSSRLRTAA